MWMPFPECKDHPWFYLDVLDRSEVSCECLQTGIHTYVNHIIQFRSYIHTNGYTWTCISISHFFCCMLHASSLSSPGWSNLQKTILDIIKWLVTYHLWSSISTGMERATCTLFLIWNFGKVHFIVFNYFPVVAFLFCISPTMVLCKQKLFSSIRLLLSKNSSRHCNVYLSNAETHVMSNNEIHYWNFSLLSGVSISM